MPYHKPMLFLLHAPHRSDLEDPIVYKRLVYTKHPAAEIARFKKDFPGASTAHALTVEHVMTLLEILLEAKGEAFAMIQPARLRKLLNRLSNE